ncbi:MAG: glycosyl hydrolase family 95 catalytic domain-containing protein, partial [Bacteroidota bacterium]
GKNGAATDAENICREELTSGFSALLRSHREWWKHYWNKSSVKLPDPLLDRQYHLEMYKLGAVARKGAPAITLQGIWTADNGKLPPWKGDFHHDLNTQLSYWPSYTGNRLEIAETFTDWLWAVREENRQYTKDFFGVDGLNVPGVTTITGQPMGGWIQYSFSPTVSAWLAQHFYWQWKYSGNHDFLKNRAYPYLKDVAVFLENILEERDGVLKLPLGSSPEYNDNRREAWFREWTNYDLALVKNAFIMAAAAADALQKPDEVAHWKNLSARLPEFDANETGLTIAPRQNLDESHRHIAQLMALHPLGLLNPGTAASDTIISRSLRRLEQMGTRWWTGYSFSWAACLYARAGKGEAAARQLQIFAENFCLPNSFHVNGDQKGGQYSNFTYRPFTLEGNFAFAQGVHEMLIQSHEGVIELFPAIPEGWKDIRFEQLRTESGLLVSAEVKKGRLVKVNITGRERKTVTVRIPAHLTGITDSPFEVREITVGPVR